MTGYKNFNREAFFEAAKRIHAHGDIALHGAWLPDGLAWEEYMSINLHMLLQCDAIYLLEEWDNSAGAIMELGRARQKNLPEIQEGFGNDPYMRDCDG